ncbi:MAG: glucose-6-phosphate dehydrogenase assembly protein OpcA [Bifidobacterium sp.]
MRFGADAGAGEIIVLRPRGGLINHPDTWLSAASAGCVVVAWWPTTPPSNPAKDLRVRWPAVASPTLQTNNPEATIERLRRN